MKPEKIRIWKGDMVNVVDAHNQAITDYEEFLPSESEIELLLTGKWDSKDIAKAIARRIGK